jgi:hypothetical protein
MQHRRGRGVRKGEKKVEMKPKRSSRFVVCVYSVVMGMINVCNYYLSEKK